jgi:hypothetical protein
LLKGCGFRASGASIPSHRHARATWQRSLLSTDLRELRIYFGVRRTFESSANYGTVNTSNCEATGWIRQTLIRLAPALSHLNRLQRGSARVCGLRCGQVASVQAANIRPGSCITQLNDVAFFVVGGNLILCEARPPLCLCKPINSVLWLAYCKLSTQPSLRPKLHNVLHELHSCRVKSFTLAPYQSCDRESFQFGLQKEDKLTVYFFNVLARTPPSNFSALTPVSNPGFLGHANRPALKCVFAWRSFIHR